MAPPLIHLLIGLFACLAIASPATSFAVQTQQTGLIRSVVLDAPTDEPELIRALSGLRGKPLTPQLRGATHKRLAAATDRLGWTGVEITVPVALGPNGRWMVTVRGQQPQQTRPATRPITREYKSTVAAPADYASPTVISKSPTIDEWRVDAHARVLIVRNSHQLFAKFGTVVEQFPVAVGRRSNPTPLGRYHVQSIAHKPTWFPTKRMRTVALQRGRELPKRVPPGPANPLGDWFVALGHSIGIHGNNSPWSIGRSVSSGCVRMRNADIERVARSLAKGDSVWVVDKLAPPAPGQQPETRPVVAQTAATSNPQQPTANAGIGLSVGPASP